MQGTGWAGCSSEKGVSLPLSFKSQVEDWVKPALSTVTLSLDWSLGHTKQVSSGKEAPENHELTHARRMPESPGSTHCYLWGGPLCPSSSSFSSQVLPEAGAGGPSGAGYGWNSRQLSQLKTIHFRSMS